MNIFNLSKVRIKDILYCASLSIACHFIKMLFSVIDLPYMPPQWSCCYACLIRYAAGLGSFCSVILIISIVIAAAALIFFPLTSRERSELQSVSPSIF